MAQTPNKVISNFQERLSWVVSNLDPDPSYRRFVYDYNDVFTALQEALDRNEFYKGSGKEVPKNRQWQNALKGNNPSQFFLDWVYTLYRDMTANHFETEPYDEFLMLGEEIQRHRERWRPAIRYFAEHRTELASIARSFYAGCGNTNEHDSDDLEFPLLTMPGWIRSKPLSLYEGSERRLTAPRAGVKFEDRRLEGLKGDYVAYKGALAYATRKVVRPEPQHNGQIFCARSVLSDDNGFIGFEYSLSKYFTYINTCEILGAELADWVVRNGGTDKPPPKLPFRKSPSDAFDLTNRAAYPGINCLCVLLNYSDTDPLRRKPGDYFLLHKRDETQLQAQNTSHVVPAGGHQGFSQAAQVEDTAIWRTMAREFAEELFDMEDLNQQPPSWGDFRAGKVEKIIDVFFGRANAAAKVHLLGFGLDPITLKPEVLVTIVIDWQKAKKQWPDAKLKFNWELQTGAKDHRCHWEPLSRQNLLRQAKGGVLSFEHADTYLGTLPAGAACMLLAARHYDQLGLPDTD